jgi:hypothetical protein
MSGSLRIEIETGNDAFADGAEANGLARFLRKAARMIEDGHTEFRLYDHNGNRVGYCEYEPGEYDDDAEEDDAEEDDAEEDDAEEE